MRQPHAAARNPAREPAHEDFCYYHHATRKRHLRTSVASENPAQTAFDLPLSEDRSSIQAAIGEVLRHIACNTLDPRRAGLLLYGLQIAALNLPPHPRPHPLHERDEIPASVTAIVIPPTHGPVAPAAELAPPSEYKFIGQMLLEEFGPPPPEFAGPEPPAPSSVPTRHPTWGKLPDPYAAAQQQKQQGQQESAPEKEAPVPTILPALEATGHWVPDVSLLRHGFPFPRCFRKRKGYRPHPQPNVRTSDQTNAPRTAARTIGPRGRPMSRF